MGTKLSDFPTHVQKRIQEQIDRDDSLAGLQTHVPKQAIAKALDSGKRKQSQGKVGVVCSVSFIVCARRELDSDNLSGSLKGCRDAIAETLGIDDGDKRVEWCYHQIQTRGAEGVIVKFEL